MVVSSAIDTVLCYFVEVTTVAFLVLDSARMPSTC